MTDYQGLIFDWVADQHALTGLTILAGGLAYGFCGLRAIRFLVIPPCIGLGYVAGAVLEAYTSAPPFLIGGGMALLGAILALAWWKAGLVVSAGGVGAAFGGYLALQFGLGEIAVLIGLGAFGVTSAILALLSRQSMAVLATAVLGSALIVVGFVGLSSAAWPSLGVTFRFVAARYSAVVPILMAMVAAMAYSCQMSSRQGDILTGAQGTQAP